MRAGAEAFGVPDSDASSSSYLGVEDFGCKNIEVIMDILIFEELPVAIGLEMNRVRSGEMDTGTSVCQ